MLLTQLMTLYNVIAGNGEHEVVPPGGLGAAELQRRLQAERGTGLRL